MLKKSQGHSPFFLSDHSRHMETGRSLKSLRSLGSLGSLNQFFSDSGDPSEPNDYMETGLKVRTVGKNEGGLAHQMLLVQLSSEKNSASSSIPAVNLSVILKEIERATLICDYF